MGWPLLHGLETTLNKGAKGGGVVFLQMIRFASSGITIVRLWSFIKLFVMAEQSRTSAKDANNPASLGVKGCGILVIIDFETNGSQTYR